MSNNIKVLVTGTTGFISSYIVEKKVELDYDVIGTDYFIDYVIS